uniref:Uncharacterized protein n=1 Tax=Arundo donax TaxID=35708 RepID=A0A0A9DQY3_ARUDO
MSPAASPAGMARGTCARGGAPGRRARRGGAPA